MEPDWIDESAQDEDEEQDITIGEYDLTSTPNDFNIKTIVDFINQGVFEIPAFQRNYVWDLRRASKLIESVVMGLPIPQIFLYESRRNKFLVVDGQQRLMSIHYFVQKRFPRIEKRSALRRIFDEKGKIPSDLLADDAHFMNFNLQLPSRLGDQENKLNKLNYETLGELKTVLDLKTIRCVVIKQNAPQNDDSSVYEIFNRLNTGGVNLTPQEIRTSLYHSEFYKMLYRLNANERWRHLINAPEPDLRMRDVEILLRGFAMLLKGQTYKPSMTRFLNHFSKEMKEKQSVDLRRLEDMFRAFLDACNGLPQGIFGTRSKRINVSVFEAVFAATCEYTNGAYSTGKVALSEQRIARLKADQEFAEAASTKSTNQDKVAIRLRRAREIFALAQ